MDFIISSIMHATPFVAAAVVIMAIVLTAFVCLSLIFDEYFSTDEDDDEPY